MSARVSASSSTRSLRVLIFNLPSLFRNILEITVTPNVSSSIQWYQIRRAKLFQFPLTLQSLQNINFLESKWNSLTLKDLFFPWPIFVTCDNLKQRTNCCTLSLWNYLPAKSHVSSGHSLLYCCGIQTSELTLSSFQSSRYLLQRVKYLFSIPRVFCTLLDKVVTKSMMAGLDEMSEKKLNTTGSSSPSACWGGVSMHVPCIQRTNILVLWRKWTVSVEKEHWGQANHDDNGNENQTKLLMSKTMAVHVHYKSLYIS